ncbi:hypothetical protein Acr_28g0002820 [Actinidia rufa]|uniref:Uncharacterized protein n=1 Tax=Actinidia rufa TaxID=165716 RepID=A0A7J0H908_9ERIC|nr:hypothetical protein Acr_28g0002820 [Actinidia rufa]
MARDTTLPQWSSDLTAVESCMTNSSDSSCITVDSLKDLIYQNTYARPLIDCIFQPLDRFVMEFAESLILRRMEDPKERNLKLREHLCEVQKWCSKTNEIWSYVLHPYGFGRSSITKLSSSGTLRLARLLVAVTL